MAQFPAEAWYLIVAVALAAMLAMLHSLSLYYREQTKVHDLRIRVQELRTQYRTRLANLAAASECDVIPLMERKPGAPEAAKKAA
jgi:hypothetical protein